MIPFKKNNRTISSNNITTALIAVVILFLTLSCNKTEKAEIEAIVDRSAMPKLHATEVTTVISDSGITRYRITATQWDVFDRANQPYWEFTKGFHFEKFDEQLHVDVNLHSDYAKFLEREQLWEWKGNVRVTNIKGELFETDHLFWSQREERFYTDSLVKITQATLILNAIGFEGNQTMTKYSFRQAQGVLPVEENEINPGN